VTHIFVHTYIMHVAAGALKHTLSYWAISHILIELYQSR